MALSELFLFSRRDLVRTVVLVALLAAACIWLSFRFIEPIPPRRIVIASGPEFSLFHQQAQRYKAALAAEGVTLEERITEGAGENYRLLLDRKSGVDIAFVQGGIATFPEADSLVMIASLYYEPLWIFLRRGEPIDALAALRGKRVSMGMPGSGTNALATPLLAASGVTSTNTNLQRVPTDHARVALKGWRRRRRIDGRRNPHPGDPCGIDRPGTAACQSRAGGCLSAAVSVPDPAYAACRRQSSSFRSRPSATSH